MDFNIENDSSTDTDVGWYGNNLACNAGAISGLFISRMVTAIFFSDLITKKSLQMLRESRPENLKILIAPLNIKLSSLKSTGTASTVVPWFINLYFVTKASDHILRPKKENMTF